ncbi:hypothetical protein FIBSPDRAFT_932249 [Athelia psychrophila]|uniref:Uncharacterized protein n=1 Tax=Athelia psychrophila TaxID=1759441 RepID=A0A166J892_9AGAM|nr:hypothetical protein FIBSPDRAFT_932249 [Fibularhizoctonia sp. CBS 109695]
MTTTASAASASPNSPTPISPFSRHKLHSEATSWYRQLLTRTRHRAEQPDMGAFTIVFRDLNHVQPPRSFAFPPRRRPALGQPITKEHEVSGSSLDTESRPKGRLAEIEEYSGVDVDGQPCLGLEESLSSIVAVHVHTIAETTTVGGDHGRRHWVMCCSSLDNSSSHISLLMASLLIIDYESTKDPSSRERRLLSGSSRFFGASNPHRILGYEVHVYTRVPDDRRNYSGANANNSCSTAAATIDGRSMYSYIKADGPYAVLKSWPSEIDPEPALQHYQPHLVLPGNQAEWNGKSSLGHRLRVNPILTDNEPSTRRYSSISLIT